MLKLSATDESQLATTITGILATPGVDALVSRYLAGPPEATFAGDLFDTLGPTSHDRFTVADIAAVSLLDVRFDPQALQALLTSRYLRRCLAEIGPDIDIWNEGAPLSQLYDLYATLRTLPNVGSTKASKLLARKRPRLAPITDSVVCNVLDTKGWAHLHTLARVLRGDEALRARLRTLGGAQVTELRALDIAVWMIGSNSRSARTARKEIGIGQAKPLVHPNRQEGH